MSHFALRCGPFAIVIALFILIVSLLSALDWKLERVANAAVSVPPAADRAVAPASSVRVARDYGKLPISFEVNQWQTDRSVQFLARGVGYTLFLRPGEAVLSLHAPHADTGKPGGPFIPGALRPSSRQLLAPTPACTVRLQLIGSNTKAEATGVDPLPGKTNYFIGSDPAKWHTDVPTYAKVRYSNVYPGVDLIYYGNREGRLEHDFVVAPGADTNQISFDLRSNQAVAVESGGSLRLRTVAGDLSMMRPVAYQTIDGHRTNVPADYVISGKNRIKFRLGSHDRSTPLVIDPVLAYTAVFGGSGGDAAAGLVVDSTGAVYLVGTTSSPDFPLVNPYQSTPANGFISKISSDGSALLYSTFISGQPGWIARDGSGRIYVAGMTGGGLPVKNAYQPTYGGNGDAFVTVLSPAGNELEWSTYLGGSQLDYTNAMAVDEAGNVYVSGRTDGGFPASHSLPPAGSGGVWFAKFNSSGGLQYSTIYGTSGQSVAMTADSSGAAYITGYTNGNDIPLTPGAFRSTCPSICAWAAKLNPSGDSLAYSTYLGAVAGNGGSAGGTAIALDSDLNAYIGGVTGPGLPVWSSGFQRSYGGGDWDGFVVKLNATGTNLIWSTYLGGNAEDQVTSLALDQHRQVYVAGMSCSPNFPLKAAIQGYVPSSSTLECQSFVTTLSGSLSSIPYYSTFLGKASTSEGLAFPAIAVDRYLNVYVAGLDNGNIQATPGAFSIGSLKDGYKVFLLKLVIMDDLALGLSASPSSVVQGSNLAYTIAVTSKGPDFGSNLRISDTLPAGTTFVSYDAGGGACTAPAPGGTGTLNCTLRQLNKGATWNVNLTVKVNAAAGTTLSNTAATISNMQDFVISNNSAKITTRVN
jgi:uncharacterized repeat protein (TIGR01451 family)